MAAASAAGRFFGVAAGRPPGLRPAGRLVGRSAARPAAVRPPSRRPARLESRSAPVPMSTAANVGHHGGPVGPLDRTWRKSSKCWSAQVLLRCTPAPRRWHAPPPPRPWLRVSALCVRACLHVPVPRALARAFEGNGVQCVQRACVQYASRAFNACKCVAGSPAATRPATRPPWLAARLSAGHIHLGRPQFEPGRPLAAPGQPGGQLAARLAARKVLPARVANHAPRNG